MKSHKPSRTLNEQSVLMGLNYSDLVGLALLLLVLQMSFKPFHGEIAALMVTLAVGLILSGLRLKYRRKIVRDFVTARFGPKRL